MSGPAEILSDRFEDVVGKQEVLRERYGILIPVMDDQKIWIQTKLQRKKNNWRLFWKSC